MRNNRWMQSRLKDLKKTQRGLAKALSVEPPRVTEIIKGERDVSASEVVKIARVMEMPETAVLANLTGEKVQHSDMRMKLEAYVGAGELVVPIDDGEPVEWIDAPPVGANGFAVTVRGDSMEPAYHSGDILVLGDKGDPDRFLGRDCVVRLVTGAAYVKRLAKGSRKGRYHLLSHNRPDVITDSRLEWAAPILWVKKA